MSTDLPDDLPEKKWYVYLLCDPDTEQPFYVGKGKGERIHYHEHTLNHRSDSKLGKRWAIRQILDRGKQVLKKKVAEFDDEREAYAHEVALIKQYGSQLTNIKPGGGRLYPDEASESKIGRKGRKCIPFNYSAYTTSNPYMPLKQVAKELGWTELELREITEKLGIQRHKFPLNKVKWIASADIDRLRTYQLYLKSK